MKQKIQLCSLLERHFNKIFAFVDVLLAKEVVLGTDGTVYTEMKSTGAS